MAIPPPTAAAPSRYLTALPLCVFLDAFWEDLGFPCAKTGATIIDERAVTQRILPASLRVDCIKPPILTQQLARRK